MSLLLVLSLAVNSYLITGSRVTKREYIKKMVESIYGDTTRIKMAAARKLFVGKLISEGAADRLFIIDNANNTIGSKYETRECLVNVLKSGKGNNSNGEDMYLVQLSVHVKGLVDRWYNKEFILYEGEDGLIYSVSKWDLD